MYIAQKNNDYNAVNNYTKLLYKNVSDRASFFASINPYWIKNDWLALLNSYTSMQIQGATAFSTKDYAQSIAIFDSALALSTIMGDYFSEGLTYYYMKDQQNQPVQPAQPAFYP